MTQPTEGGEYLYGPGFIGLQNAKSKQRENLLAMPTSTAVKPPIILMVHGGWWSDDHAGPGETEESEAPFVILPYCESLVARGYSVVDVNYVEDLDPLAGSGSTLYTANRFGFVSAFPAQYECVMRAAEWAILNAGKINGDANRLVILGGSTGGNIVHRACQLLNAAEPGLVKACISLSGPTNLYTLYESMTTEASRIKVAKAVGATTAEMLTPTNPLAVQPSLGSPALHVAPTNAPTFIYGGLKEAIIPYFQQTEMAEALAEQGIPYNLLTLPGSGHSFAAWTPTIREAVISWLHSLGL